MVASTSSSRPPKEAVLGLNSSTRWGAADSHNRAMGSSPLIPPQLFFERLCQLCDQVVTYDQAK